MMDTVTSVVADRGGYRVTVNDSETFRLSHAEYRAMPLEQGQELNWETYQKDLLLLQYPTALDRSVRLLAIRPRSRHEIERSLQMRGCMPDTVEMVLYKLEKEKLLDDDAFARSWAEARTRLRIGKARILQELRMKGVDSETAEAALAELNEEEQDTQALALAIKLLGRYNSLTPTEAVRKSVSAMQRRGYSYGEASRALRKAMETVDD